VSQDTGGFFFARALAFRRARGRAALDKTGAGRLSFQRRMAGPPNAKRREYDHTSLATGRLARAHRKRAGASRDDPDGKDATHVIL